MPSIKSCGKLHSVEGEGEYDIQKTQYGCTYIVKDMTDEQLVGHMAARSETALVELHARYAPYLAAVARRMLNSPDEVQQCVQDAFVNAWDYADRYDENKSRAKTWLVTICHRLAINRLRKTQLETMPLQSWDAPARQPDHLESIMLKQALDALDEESKELIQLTYYRGHSHSQVADLTGKPLGTVKSQIRNALMTLRTTLKGGEA